MIYAKHINTNKAVYFEIIIPVYKCKTQGVAHLLEHLILKNNLLLTQDEIRYNRQKYELNAETYSEYMKISCYVSRKNFKDALQFVSNLLYHAKIDDNWKNELSIIDDELNLSQDKKYSQNYNKILKSVFKDYKNANILGDLNKISLLKTKDITKEYEMIKNNTVDIIVIGNYNVLNLKHTLKAFFKCNDFVDYPQSIDIKSRIMPEKRTENYIFYNYVYPLEFDHRVHTELMLRNLQYFSYLAMNKAFKDKKQIFYDFYTNYIILRDKLVFYFVFYCEKHKLQMLKKEFSKVIDDLKNPSKEDYEKLKSILKSEKDKHISSPKEEYLFENVKNYKKLYIEKDMIDLRLKDIKFSEYKDFVSRLLQDKFINI